MNSPIRTKLRNYIQGKMHAKGETKGFSDSDSLFTSGRLDSLDAVELVVLLEDDYGADFVKTGFDQELIDSIDAIMELIENHGRHGVS
jgi:acyl carrier protein